MDQGGKVSVSHTRAGGAASRRTISTATGRGSRASMIEGPGEVAVQRDGTKVPGKGGWRFRSGSGFAGRATPIRIVRLTRVAGRRRQPP